MELISDKHILVLCKTCKLHKVVETTTHHYCSPECAKQYFTDYWRKNWLKRKTDPVAKEHARKAAQRYRQKHK